MRKNMHTNNQNKSNRLSRKLIGAKSSLFGNFEEPKEEFSNPNPTMSQQYQEFEKDQMEERIQETTRKLRQGVQDLKQISITIKDHTTNDNLFLGKMENNMGDTKDGLKKAQNKLKTLMQQKSTRHMCILILFIMFVFFAIYFLIKFAMKKE